MKKGYTHLSILLDRSGSMNSIKKAVLEGFNKLIEEQKKVEGKLTVSFKQFFSQYTSEAVSNTPNFRFGTSTSTIGRHVPFLLGYNFQHLSEVKLLTEGSYTPDGGTPLNDSLVKFIKETGEILAKMEESERPEKVMFVVISDGEENTSTEYTEEDVKALVEQQEKVYSWKFLYIGANQDVEKESSSRGFTMGFTFDADLDNTKSMYNATSAVLANYRSKMTYSNAEIQADFNNAMNTDNK